MKPPKANAMGVHLRGDRNQCAGCGLLFNSLRAFDKHRSGEHRGNRRICLSPDAMRLAGMVLGADHFWRGSAMPAAVLSRIEAA